MSWLTTAAVCERYDVGPRTVYRWTEQGILPQPVRFNGHYKYWNREELDARDKAHVAAARPTARQLLDQARP